MMEESSRRQQQVAVGNPAAPDRPDDGSCRKKTDGRNGGIVEYWNDGMMEESSIPNAFGTGGSGSPGQTKQSGVGPAFRREDGRSEVEKMGKWEVWKIGIVEESGSGQRQIAGACNFLEKSCSFPEVSTKFALQPNIIIMGKGDRKTRRGKITKKTYGVRRPKKKTTETAGNSSSKKK